jgi:antitoxin PrlF
LPYKIPVVKLTVTSKGQITLRREVLSHLGVVPGDKVEVNLLPDGGVALKAAPAGDIRATFGMLKPKGEQVLSIDDMREIAAAGWADLS